MHNMIECHDILYILEDKRKIKTLQWLIFLDIYM